MDNSSSTSFAAKGKYDRLFKESLNKLNKEQLEAVVNIEGPVLVNAGPGTGKTQILATRIGKILYETDTAPHNILCLTYTDAATIAMRKRLVEIIGPTAHQIHIFTFHGFCNQVIQENLDYFGGYRQLEPITDLESIDIYKELIDNLPNGNILKRYKQDRYFEKGRMSNLFSLMKKENIKPLEFIETINKHLEEEKENEKYIAKRASTKKGVSFKKGDFRYDHFEEYATKFEETKAAIEQYENFEKIMLANERYDYDDMILWVLKAFQENEYLLLQYQERYHYFLIDEYQDTNGAQNAILSELISYWDQPNVFVVGDDDQAIFKFQGANLRNLVDFKNRYDPTTIVLIQNYRSNQPILDASKQLIGFNKERIIVEDPSLSKEIIAVGEYKTNECMPSVLCFQKQSEEYAYIAKEIETLYKRDIHELTDTAVIYRNHAQINDLISICEKRGIPYNVKKKVNVLQLPFIKNIINLLKYISEEYDKNYSASARLFELMHYSYFELNAHDIAKISHYSNVRRSELKETKLRDVIANRDILESFNLNDIDSILKLSDNLEKWISDIANMTVQSLFENILNDGNILSYIINRHDKAWLLQIVSSLFDFIKNETVKNPDLNLMEIIKLINQMIDNKIELPVNKSITSEIGVNFITAHSAKGLEFKNVFMISCTKKVWDKKGNTRGNYKYPDGVNTSSELTIEDDRRLFYVAMTRAKTNLQISYSIRDEEGKDLGASQFIDEISDSETIKLENPQVNEETLVEFYYDILRKNEPKISLIESEIIKDWLKDYKLSVTHLNKYLRCPLTFYFEIILKVPSARNASTGFGTAMHDALRAFFENYKAKDLKDKSHLLYFFKDSMNKHKSHFTKDEFEAYLSTGENTLNLVYDDRMDRWLNVPKFALEEEVSNAESDGIPLKGFLDKVDIFDNHVHVIDYKTGNAQNGKKKTVRPSEKNETGGDYWRQLVFYKILLDSDKKHSWNMQSAEIDFLEPDRKTQQFTNWIYSVSPEDISIVKDQIKSSYQKILNHEFEIGCGEEDCNWCSFAHRNELIDSQ